MSDLPQGGAYHSHLALSCRCVGLYLGFPVYDSPYTRQVMTKDLPSPCFVAPLVTTAWRVLGLWMEERPSAMEGGCECFE
jgi:hypothetical protein